MLNALLPLERAPLARVSEPPSARGMLRWADGSATVVFSLERYDARERAAIYRLCVTNSARQRLTCGLWSARDDGALALAFPNPIAIEPLASKDVRVLVPVDREAPFRYALLTVQADGLAATFEAPAPSRRRVQRPPLAAPLAAVAVAVAFAALLVTGVPRITALAPPPLVMAGTTIDAPYAAVGFGTLGYEVRSLDGARIGGGTLDARSGTIAIPLPDTRDERSYTLALTLRGLLGNATSERVVTARPPRLERARIASISQLSVSPTIADAGGALRVAYAASADAGEVRLADADGTVWARAPFSRSGESTLRVPAFSSARDLRVELAVRRGSSVARSAAGVLVRPSSAPAPANAATDASPVALASPAVRGGGTIALAIHAGASNLRLALTDDHAHELATLDVPADATDATLSAPRVERATRYYVVARYEGALGDESSVLPVTVTP